MPHRVRKGQRTTCRSELFPSAMDELPGLSQVVSLCHQCFHLLRHLAGSHLAIKYGHRDIKHPLRPPILEREKLAPHTANPMK